MTHKSLRHRLARFMLIAFLVLQPWNARAEAMKEFIMSCSYGVLAGTLVGAASLAFTDQPGENLNKIARGASFGLYAGMILGFYVVYGVDEEGEGGEVLMLQPTKVRTVSLPRVSLIPQFHNQSIDGATVQVALLKF